MKKLFAVVGLVLVLAASFVALTPSRTPATPGNAALSSTWALAAQPAATTAPIATTAAKAGYRHVATSVTVCISALAAQPDLVFKLRDGASGAGTTVWLARLAMPTVGGAQCVTSGPIQIYGSVNTAMTLEAPAPASTNFATASLNGYDVSGG